ncbi:hypothetical protein Tco_0870614 [Tanacetum coccineum]
MPRPVASIDLKTGCEKLGSARTGAEAMIFFKFSKADWASEHHKNPSFLVSSVKGLAIFPYEYEGLSWRLSGLAKNHCLEYSAPYVTACASGDDCDYLIHAAESIHALERFGGDGAVYSLDSWGESSFVLLFGLAVAKIIDPVSNLRAFGVPTKSKGPSVEERALSFLEARDRVKKRPCWKIVSGIRVNQQIQFVLSRFFHYINWYQEPKFLIKMPPTRNRDINDIYEQELDQRIIARMDE